MRPWTPQLPSQGLPRPPQDRFPGDSPDRSPIARLALYRGSVVGWTGLLGLLVVLAIVGVRVAIHAGVVPVLTHADAAQVAAVRTFCADEARQDYGAAYGLLSPHHTQTLGLTRDEFFQDLQRRDQKRGPVRACAVTGGDVVATILWAAPTYDVTVTLGDGTRTGTVSVTQDGGWEIDRMDAQLHLDG